MTSQFSISKFIALYNSHHRVCASNAGSTIVVIMMLREKHHWSMLAMMMFRINAFWTHIPGNFSPRKSLNVDTESCLERALTVCLLKLSHFRTRHSRRICAWNDCFPLFPPPSIRSSSLYSSSSNLNFPCCISTWSYYLAHGGGKALTTFIKSNFNSGSTILCWI